MKDKTRVLEDGPDTEYVNPCGTSEWYCADRQHNTNEWRSSKWQYHSEGKRAFVLDSHGYTIFEVVAPGNNCNIALAAAVVRDHNLLIDILKDADSIQAHKRNADAAALDNAMWHVWDKRHED